ncbi:MAG: phenylalanine--tRNA ligase subunit alpha [Candidatus Shapirobacteria bacterium]
MNYDLEKIKTEIQTVGEAAALEELRIKYLGRNGLINQLFKKIKDKSPEERKKFGQEFNGLKVQIEKLIQEQKTTVKKTKTEIGEKEPLCQLPKHGHLHPIAVTENEINAIFKSLGFSIYDGPEIETDEYCFQRLNVPPDHPARDMQDTIYIQEPEWLLRTQASSVEARLLAQEKPPFRAAFPGIVYRNEKLTKSNHFIFYHYQGVAVDKDITMKDLIGTIDLLFKHLYGPEVLVRYRNKYYPEVEPGLGVDLQCFECYGKGCSLCKGFGWLEMGGAGIIHPKVLQIAGIDPQKWRGFAFGLGLDRWVMAKYQIKDIRTLTGGNLAYQPNIL